MRKWCKCLSNKRRNIGRSIWKLMVKQKASSSLSLNAEKRSTISLPTPHALFSGTATPEVIKHRQQLVYKHTDARTDLMDYGEQNTMKKRKQKEWGLQRQLDFNGRSEGFHLAFRIPLHAPNQFWNVINCNRELSKLFKILHATVAEGCVPKLMGLLYCCIEV